MSTRRKLGRYRGQGFLDNIPELASNIDVGNVIDTGSKVLTPLLQKLGIIPPPSRGGRGRGGVYKNQGSGRFKKGSIEAKKYMTRLRSMRGKGVSAVTDASQLSQEEMLDFMKMKAAMDAHRQNKEQTVDSDEDDD